MFKNQNSKSVSLLILFILVYTSIWAQESKKYNRLKKKWNYLDGYVITKDSVKREGLIKWVAKSRAARFNKVRFISKEGKSRTYYPETCNGFGYDSLEFVSDQHFFFKVILKTERVNLLKTIGVYQDGYMYWNGIKYVTTSNPSLLDYLSAGTGGLQPNIVKSADLYFQKRGEAKIKQISSENFDQRLSEYFLDCPVLSWKIREKVLTKDDIVRIIQIYNEECK